jgi:hypothetical protein
MSSASSRAASRLTRALASPSTRTQPSSRASSTVSSGKWRCILVTNCVSVSLARIGRARGRRSNRAAVAGERKTPSFHTKRYGRPWPSITRSGTGVKTIIVSIY